ncbi:MAG: FG-GAP repeat protein [Actinomycetota bacterium]|nr:FG-GAP repeat protein [Actinomycetota bacterium]
MAAGWIMAGSAVAVFAAPATSEEPTVPVVTETQRVDRGLGQSDLFGVRVVMDGCVALADYYQEDIPKVEPFVYDGTWTTTEVLAPVTRGREFDVSGDTLVFGGGPAHVFRRVDDGWESEVMLSTLHPVSSIALDVDTLVIGDTWNAMAHVYRRRLGLWTREATLAVDEATSAQGFGRAVAVHGDTVVVGAPDAGGADAYYGAAHVFTRAQGGWTWTAELGPIDGTSFEGRFGSAVAVDRDTIVVGEPGSADRGAAHVFTARDQRWSPQARLADPDTSTYAEFGRGRRRCGLGR